MSTPADLDEWGQSEGGHTDYRDIRRCYLPARKVGALELLGAFLRITVNNTQNHLTAMLPIKTPSKSGAAVFQCEDFGDRGLQLVIVDQLRNLDELGSVRFEDEVDGCDAAFGGSVLRRFGRDRDEPAAASEAQQEIAPTPGLTRVATRGARRRQHSLLR